MLGIETNETSTDKKEKEYDGPILQTKVDLCALQKDIYSNEPIKNGTYIWKDGSGIGQK